ncbi:MAG: helix-turn-helix domain-containing protein [Oscillospiraceae bacterium]|nr:helix-turn-helix domain-containing protein [Oscillospiraceae bacterium]
MNEIAEMYASYPDMLSPLQLMEMLCISKTSTYRLLSENVIPHLKMGRIYRIPKAYVIKYIADNTVAAATTDRSSEVSAVAM